ncbi:hypothetical protein [Microbulbifer sp. SSSA005]|uniref:hypothetical protein n=1 Tax=unclassified Microbulbifer TaxID=2619833 RepID=UPI004039C9C4
MSERDELVRMGEKLVEKFSEKLDQREGGDLWRKDVVLACEILLDYLRAKPVEIDKVLLLAHVFQKKHELNKPPVVSYWCRKITECLLQEQS